MGNKQSMEEFDALESLYKEELHDFGAIISLPEYKNPTFLSDSFLTVSTDIHNLHANIHNYFIHSKFIDSKLHLNHETVTAMLKSILHRKGNVDILTDSESYLGLYMTGGFPLLKRFTVITEQVVAELMYSAIELLFPQQKALVLVIAENESININQLVWRCKNHAFAEQFALKTDEFVGEIIVVLV